MARLNTKTNKNSFTRVLNKNTSLEKTAGLGSMLKRFVNKTTVKAGTETIDEGKRALLRPIKRSVTGIADAMKTGATVGAKTTPAIGGVVTATKKLPMSRRAFLRTSAVGGAKAAVSAVPMMNRSVYNAFTLGTDSAPGITTFIDGAMKAENGLKKTLQLRDYRMQTVAGVPKEVALAKTYGKMKLRKARRPSVIMNNITSLVDGNMLQKVKPMYNITQMIR